MWVVNLIYALYALSHMSCVTNYSLLLCLMTMHCASTCPYLYFRICANYYQTMYRSYYLYLKIYRCSVLAISYDLCFDNMYIDMWTPFSKFIYLTSNVLANCQICHIYFKYIPCILILPYLLSTYIAIFLHNRYPYLYQPCVL